MNCTDGLKAQASSQIQTKQNNKFNYRKGLSKFH